MTEQRPDSRPAPARPGRRGSSAFGTDLLTDLFVNPLDPGYADAAERRRKAGPLSRSRLLAGRGGTAVVLLVFGFLVAVAYQQVVAEAPEAARIRDRLVDDVLSSRAESESLERRAARLRDEVTAERDRALGGGEQADRLHDLEAATGLATVKGPGTTVTVTDAPAETDPVTGEASDQNLGRVLDRDLQRVVNALWASGAEAVAIDGRRLSGVSTIRAAGEAILVDFTPVDSPYVVQAIGPPGMRQRFESSVAAQQLRWLRQEYGMGYSVRDQDSLTLPAAADPQLRYAAPPKPKTSPSPSGG